MAATVSPTASSAHQSTLVSHPDPEFRQALDEAKMVAPTIHACSSIGTVFSTLPHHHSMWKAWSMYFCSSCHASGQKAARKKNQPSPSGNRTRGCAVRTRDVSHYTNEEMSSTRSLVNRAPHCKRIREGPNIAMCPLSSHTFPLLSSHSPLWACTGLPLLAKRRALGQCMSNCGSPWGSSLWRDGRAV
jgi:hypothetical protein